jgi:hypothetical protein
MWGSRQDTRLTWGIRVMVLGRELVTGQQRGDRGPAIAVIFDSHRFVVASLKRNHKFGCKMFNGIAVGRPRIVVGFEMETKVGAKMSRDGSAEIGDGGDAGLSLLEESIELLRLARSAGHGEDLVAVKTPEKCVTHIKEGRETPGVRYLFWIGTVAEGRKCMSYFLQVVTGGDREALWGMSGDGDKPVLKLRFDGIQKGTKWFVCTAENLNALLQFGEANCCRPD